MNTHLTRMLGLLITIMASASHARAASPTPIDMHEKFAALNAQNWEQAFADTGTKDWRKHWVLDGERAVITNTPQGMIFAAGPIPDDNASHAVLWTRQSFRGDVKIEWDYTRLDTINRNVNIIYIEAAGVGRPPYSQDITEWAGLRQIPYMKLYFENMNLLHISYAAFSNNRAETGDYVRARRYPTAPDRPFAQTDIAPDYSNTGLFIPGETYHFTIIKTDQDMFFEVKGNGAQKLFHWPLGNVEPLSGGPIGIRHMSTRCSRYRNIVISTLPTR